MAREYFCAYHSFIETLTPYGDAECGRLFRAALVYSATGKEEEFRGNERYIWPTIKQMIDRDREAYNAKCQINRMNGSKANAPERYRTVPNGTQEKEKEKEKEEGKDKDNPSEKENPSPATAGSGKEKEAPKRFTPPTVEEVRAYCLERGNAVDPEKWHAYYTSNGWMVGRNRMKDWRAAVRTWERNAPAARSSAPRDETKTMDQVRRLREKIAGS